MRRVSSTQETVIVERSGQPQVVILSIAHYKRLITTQESSRWQQQLRELHDRIQEETARHEFPDASGVIRQMREERDDQLLDLR